MTQIKKAAVCLTCLVCVVFSRSQNLPDTLQHKYDNAIGFNAKGKVLFNYYQTLDGSISEQLNLLVRFLSRFTDANDKVGVAYTQIYLGWVTAQIGDLSSTLKYCLAPVPQFELAKDTFGLIFSNWGIAYSFAYSQKAEQALKYWKKALSLSNNYRRHVHSTALNNLADCYNSFKLADSALPYIREAVRLDAEAGDSVSLASSFGTLGETYLELKQYDTAIKFLRLSLSLAKRKNISFAIANTLNSMSRLFFETSELDTALVYAYRSLAYGQSDYLLSAMNNYDRLHEIFRLKYQPDSAYKYFQLTTNVRDSLLSMQKNQSIQILGFQEQFRQQEIKQAEKNYRIKLRTYALLTALGLFIILAIVFFRSTRQKQKAKTKIEKAYVELRATQSQLIQSEKMASLGELTAGIAHEIQNPLNFVNNFSEVNEELIKELKTQAAAGNFDEVKAIVSDIATNSEKINHHGKRAESIVKAMLQHSRTSSGQRELTDINALCDEYLRLAYHGLRAKDKSFNVNIKTDFDNSVGKRNIVPQEIGRLILNLINNAFYAVSEKAKLPSAPGGYELLVVVSTKRLNGKVEIKIKDNGNGIPEKIVDKIFQPFFTTKPTGQGTGLGLSLAYDIIKAHGGEIKVNTKDSEGSEFVIQLPTTSHIP